MPGSLKTSLIDIWGGPEDSLEISGSAPAGASALEQEVAVVLVDQEANLLRQVRQASSPGSWSIRSKATARAWATSSLSGLGRPT